jgi:hypothetical protein
MTVSISLVSDLLLDMTDSALNGFIDEPCNQENEGSPDQKVDQSADKDTGTYYLSVCHSISLFQFVGCILSTGIYCSTAMECTCCDSAPGYGHIHAAAHSPDIPGG